jgi:hypothetical protein
MRHWSSVRCLAAAAILFESVVACGFTSQSSADGGIPDIALPPVIDATFPLVDSAATRDKQTFPCGTLSGAVTATLVCDHVFPDMNWDVTPGSGYLYIRAQFAPGTAPDASGPASQPELGFQILTPAKISPLTETCASLPPPQTGAFKPSFTASFALGAVAGWTAACASATEVLPGTSFKLVIASPGTLTTDSVGADPLDASADAFDWGTLNTELLSNSFHGTLTATLVGPDGGSPLNADLTF